MPDLSIANFVSPPPPNGAPPPNDATGPGRFGDHLQRASQSTDNTNSSSYPSPSQYSPAAPASANDPASSNYTPPSGSNSLNTTDAANGDGKSCKDQSPQSAPQDGQKADSSTSPQAGKPADAGHDEKSQEVAAAEVAAAAALQLAPASATSSEKANSAVNATSKPVTESNGNPKNEDTTTNTQPLTAIFANSQPPQSVVASPVAATGGQSSADTTNGAHTVLPASLPAGNDAVTSVFTYANRAGTEATAQATTANKPQSDARKAEAQSTAIKANDAQAAIVQAVTGASSAVDTTTPISEATAKQTRDKSNTGTGGSTPTTDNGLAAAQVLAAIQLPAPLSDGDSADDGNGQPNKPSAKLESVSSSANANSSAAGSINASTGNAANTPARLGYTFGAKPADAPGGSNGISEVDRVRFVQRVARAFQSAQDDGGQVRLRLSPPSLGSLKLEIQVQDGTLSAKLTTETESAKSLLLDNLSTLRDRLGDQNIRITRFDVEVKEPPPGGGLPDTLPGNSNPNQQGQQPSNRRSKNTDDAGTAPISAARRSSIGDASQLNVVI